MTRISAVLAGILMLAVNGVLGANLQSALTGSTAGAMAAGSTPATTAASSSGTPGIAGSSQPSGQFEFADPKQQIDFYLGPDQLAFTTVNIRFIPAVKKDPAASNPQDAAKNENAGNAAQDKNQKKSPAKQGDAKKRTSKKKGAGGKTITAQKINGGKGTNSPANDSNRLSPFRARAFQCPNSSLKWMLRISDPNPNGQGPIIKISALVLPMW